MSSSKSFLAENRLYWLLPLLLVAALVGWLLISEGETQAPAIDTDESFDYDAR